MIAASGQLKLQQSTRAKTPGKMQIKTINSQQSGAKEVKNFRISSGKQTTGWQATRTTAGDTETLAVNTITMNSMTNGSAYFGSRARSAHPGRRFKNREIDLNDAMIFEIIKRDGRPKKPTVLEHAAKQDHAIFEGLDNSQLLSTSDLAAATY